MQVAPPIEYGFEGSGLILTPENAFEHAYLVHMFELMEDETVFAVDELTPFCPYPSFFINSSHLYGPEKNV